MPIDQTVVIYDGQCRLCRRLVRLVRWLGPDRPFQSVDYHDQAALADCYPRVDADAAARSIIVLRADGRQLHGNDAVTEIMSLLPPVAWAAPILRLPGIRMVARRVYRWVSDHRYQFSCRVGGHAIGMHCPRANRGQ